MQGLGGINSVLFLTGFGSDSFGFGGACKVLEGFE